LIREVSLDTDFALWALPANVAHRMVRRTAGAFLRHALHLSECEAGWTAEPRADVAGRRGWIQPNLDKPSSTRCCGGGRGRGPRISGSRTGYCREFGGVRRRARRRRWRS